MFSDAFQTYSCSKLANYYNCTGRRVDGELAESAILGISVFVSSQLKATDEAISISAVRSYLDFRGSHILYSSASLRPCRKSSVLSLLRLQ